MFGNIRAVDGVQLLPQLEPIPRQRENSQPSRNRSRSLPLERFPCSVHSNFPIPVKLPRHYGNCRINPPGRRFSGTSLGQIGRIDRIVDEVGSSVDVRGLQSQDALGNHPRGTTACRILHPEPSTRPDAVALQGWRQEMKHVPKADQPLVEARSHNQALGHGFN